MLIKERVCLIAEKEGIKKEIFFNKIGMTPANFRGSAKKTPLNSTTIENILSLYPNISANWLLTGEGEMFLASDKKEPNKYNKQKDDNIIAEAEVGYQKAKRYAINDVECNQCQEKDNLLKAQDKIIALLEDKIKMLEFQLQQAKEVAPRKNSA